MNWEKNDLSKNPTEVRRLLSLRDENGKPSRLTIQLASGSMSPVLPTGSQAEIQACRLEDLKFLDMVVFWDEEKIVCHCFFGLGDMRSATGERTFISRGLASKQFDVLTSESNLIGKVVNRKIGSWEYIFYRLCNRCLGYGLTLKLLGKGAVKK